MNLFKIVSIITSVLFLYLSIQLLFMTDSFVTDLGLDPSVASLFLARRAAMFMLGVSVLMFASRNLQHSKARQIICLATGITLLGLSFMGSYEFIRGTVNTSIFIAISVETLLCGSFCIIFFKNRNVDLV
jgi:hypothetical protein